MRTQMTPQQIANLTALQSPPGNDTHSAPPIHDQETFQQVTAAVDAHNLETGVGGDAGASHEDWHEHFGHQPTVAGISAHNVRMQSGITRAGDHGEPTGALARALQIMDAVPVVGTIARGMEGLVEASQGNAHAVQAAQDTMVNGAFDAGGFLVGPALGAVGRGARAATNTARAATNSALSSARAVTRTESALVSAVATTEATVGERVVVGSGRAAVNSSEHAAIGANRAPTGVARGGPVVRATGTTTRPTIKSAAKATMNNVVVPTAMGLGGIAAMNGGHLFHDEYDNLEEEVLQRKQLFSKQELDEGVDETDDYGAPKHKAPLPNGVDPKRDQSRTSAHTTPGQTQGHNTFADHQEHLADSVVPTSGDGGAIPTHAHDTREFSNLMLLGALALGGVAFAVTRFF